ncbi:hypothetical protein MXB_2674 [Myxobolus squamalis]|nr:hypothetical protein MXB_2674 [Myxobolus squamalis]
MEKICMEFDEYQLQNFQNFNLLFYHQKITLLYDSIEDVLLTFDTILQFVNLLNGGESSCDESIFDPISQKLMENSRILKKDLEAFLPLFMF